MDRGGDGVEEAARRVGREVDGEPRPRRDRAGHLDVEHHLAVGATGVALGSVAAAVDRNRDDRGGGDAQALEVGVEVCSAVAAAELDDGDALPGAGRPGREVVEPRHLDGREGAGDRVRDDRAPVADQRPEVRPGLGAVVEPEHALDRRGDVGGHAERPGAAAVAASVELVEPELGAEGALQRRERAGEHDAAPRRAGVDDLEVVAVGEVLERADVGRVGAGQLLDLLAPEAGLRRSRLGEGAAAAQLHGDLDPLAGIGPAPAPVLGQRRALAPGELDPGCIAHRPLSSGCAGPPPGTLARGKAVSDEGLMAWGSPPPFCAAAQTREEERGRPLRGWWRGRPE